MSFSFTSLASGSKANCYLVRSEKTSILIDLGLSYTRASKLLKKKGVNAEDVKAILISHEHGDHISGLKVWNKKHPLTKIFTNMETANAMEEKFDFPINSFEIFDEFFVDDLLVSTFPLSHDSFGAAGFSIMKKDKKISVVTDTGIFSDDILEATMDSGIVVIESNHDLDMLKKGDYPWQIKKRILGKRGHLSNNACADAILKYLKKSAKSKIFLLAHLSEKNNTPRKAVSHVLDSLECHGFYNEENIYIEPLFQGIESRTFLI